jgi:ABC-type transport system involved in multi-copper enzyme maturation permease subunit
VAGYASIGDPLPPFDPEEVRARILAEGYLEGIPPEEAEIIIAETIAAERDGYEQAQEYQALQRAGYAFPYSLVTVLGSGTFLFFALILITATTVGDEFGWGTIRTVLIASSDRRRLLAVRLAALGAIAAAMLVVLLLLGVILPVLLASTGAQLPGTPGFDAGALLVLLLGELVIAMAVIAFAALATLLVRSGGLTLVSMLVYVVVEAAILTLLLRFETFQDRGAGAWALDAFPVRGITALTDAASRAASGLAQFPGEPVVRDLGAAGLPLFALVAWGALFAAVAFRRFSRMDIVE